METKLKTNSDDWATGITKREKFALEILHSMVSRDDVTMQGKSNRDEIIKISVMMADQLIIQLNKE